MGGRGSSSGRSPGGGFKTFSDRPLPGRAGLLSFGDDDSAQRAWFGENSNYAELIDSMDDEERDAFLAWSAGYFLGRQQYGGFSNMSSDAQRWTSTFDKTLDQATLNEGVVVARLSDAQLLFGAGKMTATASELRSMEGKIITSKANLSFSAASEGLVVSDKMGKSVEYHLHIPGGTIGAGMYIADKRINGCGNIQREFMSNRDIDVKVGKTTFNAARNVYEVELSFVKQLNHDYT